MKKKKYKKLKKSISDLNQTVYDFWVDTINQKSEKTENGIKEPSIDKLIPLVNQWSIDKGIKAKATPLDQYRKTFEEVEELREALQAQSEDKEYFVNSKGKRVNTSDEIKDALGDILVTVIIACQLQHLDLATCLQGAYDIISKRTGVIKDGQFVKDGDKEENKKNTLFKFYDGESLIESEEIPGSIMTSNHYMWSDNSIMTYEQRDRYNNELYGSKQCELTPTPIMEVNIKSAKENITAFNDEKIIQRNMIGGINSTTTYPPRYANETVTKFNDRMKLRVEEIKDEGLE